MKRVLVLFSAILMAGVPSDLWADAWQQVPASGQVPAARYGHTMVLVDGKAYVFGGEGVEESKVGLAGDEALEGGALFKPGELYNDLYKFEENEWVGEVPVNSPPPARKNHSAVVVDGKMYIFYGEGSAGLLNDIWVYDPTAKTWTQPPPMDRTSLSAAPATVRSW